jgi:hypothetical protein
MTVSSRAENSSEKLLTYTEIPLSDIAKQTETKTTTTTKLRNGKNFMHLLIHQLVFLKPPSSTPLYNECSCMYECWHFMQAGMQASEQASRQRATGTLRSSDKTQSGLGYVYVHI